MTETTIQAGEPALSGRRAQAARNDQAILAAARAVFIEDPDAPIAAVAQRAGVGISALYRRYPSKEDLLRKLCGDGLAAYTDAVQAAVDALGAGADPWDTFVTFMRRAVDAGSATLTARLAGTFTPSEQLYRDAIHADELNRTLIEGLRAAGAIRTDIEIGDIGLVLEQIAAVRLGDEARTNQLRHRYLTLILDGLRNCSQIPLRQAARNGRSGPPPPPSHPKPRTELPGPPPRPEELAARWSTA